MIRQSKILLTGAMMLLATTTGTAFAQNPDENKTSKGKMQGHESERGHKGGMDKMSVEDKAAMMDRMTTKEHIEFMKMTGHDMPNMTEKEHTDMMAKMSSQEKADAFDKLPMQKQKAMMRKSSKVKGDKMDKTPKN